jgi:hypothetical protein
MGAVPAELARRRVLGDQVGDLSLGRAAELARSRRDDLTD